MILSEVVLLNPRNQAALQALKMARKKVHRRSSDKILARKSEAKMSSPLHNLSFRTLLTMKMAGTAIKIIAIKSRKRRKKDHLLIKVFSSNLCMKASHSAVSTIKITLQQTQTAVRNVSKTSLT